MMQYVEETIQVNFGRFQIPSHLPIMPVVSLIFFGMVPGIF